MADTQNGSKRRGFLSRLLRDEAGNTIAIMAAAVVPVIGLVGGGVDMSRIYLVKTRLQAACDSGTLMGRRVMGPGNWADNGGKANTEANNMFTANFQDGAYGTTNLTKSFQESSAGVVSGQASVRVPMALMQVLGTEYRDISVTCRSELKIPATDVMFVLDTTGSMADPAPGGSSSKIEGLRLAASCFYETLSKENITSVSAAQCGEASDPDGSSGGNRLRFGIVPYAQSVNVGRLLPLNYIADNWTYQSRQAVFDDDASSWVAQYGTESAPSQTGSSTQNRSDTSWISYPYNTYTAPNGTQWSRRVNGNSQSQCDALLPPGYTGTTQGTMNLVSQNPDPLVHPQTLLTRNYQRVDNSATTAFRYRYTSSPRRCNLEYRQQNVVDTTRNFSTTTPITWRFNRVFSHWEYKPVTFNVSALKNTGANAWNTTLQLPVGSKGANTTVTWTGCIEERKTARVMDNSPLDNWNPVPSDAQDMDIDSTPSTSDPTTQWGPALPGLLYGREKYDGSNWYYTTDTLIRTSDGTSSENNTDVDTVSGPCPAQAALYKEWSPTQFSTYLNGLTPSGNTYHDIGLLWGARLMSPTGIFSSITDDSEVGIERHMVFMTDGDTFAQPQTYASHGLHWWDRRQNDGMSPPSQQWLIDNIDGRSQAICKWIKNKNITLWVISYGGGVNSYNENNLRACASPGKYFSATNTADLIAEFKRIAASISDLRLTE